MQIYKSNTHTHEKRHASDASGRDIAHLEEEHDIVGVGVVAPKPGVFVSSVKQLLVIATTTVIKILGIADGPDGLKFVNSTMATLAGGVYMHQIVGTSQGRIFMLGSDDNVWELNYKVRCCPHRGPSGRT